MKYFLDTSAILSDLPKDIQLSDCVICSETIKELENIKTSRYKDNDIKYRARQAVLNIINHKPTVVAYEDSLPEGDNISTDKKILLTANSYDIHKEKITLLTKDYLMYLLADDYFIKAELIDDKQQEVYKGYKKIIGNSDYINNYMLNINSSDWHTNEYLIIKNTDDDKTTEMRYDGNSFVQLKFPPSTYIKAKNSLQRCALDLMLNKDISVVCILGTYGSGKTYLSMQMAIYHVVEKKNQEKILGIREAMGTGKEIGFLKGDFKAKTEQFFLPLKQQLDAKIYEYLMLSGQIESNIPFYLKGTTYSDTIMVVDEAEDLDKTQLKLIGTRLGENSRVFMSGDYKQSEINKTANNDFVQMCHELKGNPMFGCIVLDDDVRSNTSKMFADIWNNE